MEIKLFGKWNSFMADMENSCTLQPGSVFGALGGGNLKRFEFSMMLRRWFMSCAFFWIWFTKDSNLATAYRIKVKDVINNNSHHVIFFTY